VFEGNGHVGEYVGGYDDWLRQRKQPHVAAIGSQKAVAKDKPVAKQQKNEKAKTKLSYKEQRELDALPGKIEKLEETITELEQQVSQPEFYQQDKTAISSTLGQLDALRDELQKAYERWEQLDSF
jgi:ATP-binding cassette subfamily F protein uup